MEKHGFQETQEYDFSAIEKKWQERWDKAFPKADDSSNKPKQYLLVEFPYPSGDGLHVGHVRSYAAFDALARYHRMKGENVLYPIGWDAFGLPTENYALKTGIHPRVATDQNIANFRRQMKALGLSFDWSREVDTTDPKYYQWTQWIFLQLLKQGLAYQATMPINWCPKDKIGLANEEVIGGKCERCGTEVARRMQKQWMLKITAYADRLLKDLDTVDYVPKIKTQQVNWIGKSEGAEIQFKIQNEELTIENGELRIKVFTTRPDTIFGATYLVVAPEHEIIQNSKFRIKNYTEVEKYITQAAKKSDMDRTDLAKDKTGVELKGIKAINPATHEAIPIWVADYVLMSYGTGAIMAVPAHDERDHEFAEKHHLPILTVIEPKFTARPDGESAIMPGQEFVKRDAVAAIIRSPKTGKYLCISWKTVNMHGLVTGGLEAGEDVVEAARREVREETGYVHLKHIPKPAIAIHSLFYHRVKKQNRWARFQFVFFELENEEREPVEASEAALHEVLWLSPKDMKNFFTVIEGEYILRLIEDPSYVYTGEGVLVDSPAEAVPEFEDEDSKRRPDKPTVTRKTVYVVLRNPKDDTFLCLDWNEYYWNTLIIGGMDDDDPVKAAEREIREETGYRNVRYIGNLGKLIGYYYAAHKQENRVAAAVGLVFDLVDEARDDVDEAERKKHTAKWLKREQVADFLNISSQKYVWEQYQAGVHESKAGKAPSFNSLDSRDAGKAIVEWLANKQPGQGRGKTIILLYGTAAHADKNWYPWLRRVGAEKGYDVVIPEMPDSGLPVAEKWLKALKQHENKLNQDTIIIGHSLGCVAALQWLQKAKKRIGQLILVAPVHPDMAWDKVQATHDVEQAQFITKFAQHKIDWKRVQSLAGDITVLFSDDDPYIPIETKDLYEKNLKAQYVVYHDKKHFNKKTAGMTEFPELFQFIQYPKKPNVIIIHGCGDNPEDRTYDKHWMPWLKEQLTQKGVTTDAPLMPTPWQADYQEWKREFEKQDINEETILIGHSCGAAFLVRWLGESKRKVKMLILVAPWKIARQESKYYQKKNEFYTFDIDRSIPERVGRIVMFTSDNEEHRGKASLAIFHDVLGGEVIELLNHGHYVMEHMGRAEFPEMFELLEGLFEAGEGAGLRSARFAVQYKLRDWVFSRQHYWGEPIPIIHCPEHGAVPVPEDQLPVELPYVEKYQPSGTGESPLANVKEWVNTTCPECGKPAKRETDTMPNWAGSSWYYLRYCDPANDKQFAQLKKLRYWTPVDLYNGGMEHTVLHLLYSRFWHKFLFDQGLVPTPEPYQRRHSHGIVLAEDGRKMSKSFGNVINPDDYIREYGADALRMYEMFMGPFEDMIPWSTQGIVGVHRLLKRVYDVFTAINAEARSQNSELRMKNRAGKSIGIHKKVKKVTEDLEKLRFNTAVSALMEYFNEYRDEFAMKLNSQGQLEGVEYDEEAIRKFLILLFPFAPHLASELWERLFDGDISKQSWPTFDPGKVVDDTFTLVVQVNGKVRAKIAAAAGLSEADARKLALADPNVAKHLRSEPKKVVYVKGKLINFVA